MSSALRAVGPARSAGRVLVLEPDPDLQWRIARHLTVRGHRVVGATSPSGALALTEEWLVDVVLLDESLPGYDTLDVVRRIQQAQPDARVVLMGKELAPELRLAARVAGVVQCLAKPFRVEALGELLERMRQGLLEPTPELAPGE